MQRITPLTTDHQLILECLEVLRLIANRMEAGDFVDPADITTVLEFMRDVGCECLDRTEQLLLRPAMSRAKEKEQFLRLRTASKRHHTIRPLLDDAASVITSRKHFVLHAHLLTKVLQDLIVEEDQWLLENAVELLNDPEGLRSVEMFIAREREISAVAVERGPALYRLETKYAYSQSV
jgi:hemerythrin-like domain-containing protein